MILRKNSCIILFLFGGLFLMTAQNAKPIILDIPEDWRYEKVDLPLSFAPDIPFEGFEELRFAPGMFNPKAPDYFSYFLVAAITNKKTLSKEELKTFLVAYYKGLCTTVSKAKKLTIDIDEITVALSEKNTATSTLNTIQNYTAKAVLFDVFNTGEKIELHLEIELLANPNSKGMYMLAAVSPKPKNTPVWIKLLETKESVRNFKIFNQ